MKISKQDALNWFRFFASLPEEEMPGCRQQEIALPDVPVIAFAGIA